MPRPVLDEKSADREKGGGARRVVIRAVVDVATANSEVVVMRGDDQVLVRELAALNHPDDVYSPRLSASQPPDSEFLRSLTTDSGESAVLELGEEKPACSFGAWSARATALHGVMGKDRKVLDQPAPIDPRQILVLGQTEPRGCSRGSEEGRTSDEQGDRSPEQEGAALAGTVHFRPVVSGERDCGAGVPTRLMWGEIAETNIPRGRP